MTSPNDGGAADEPALATTVVLYRTPLDGWSTRPDQAADVVSALRGLLNLFAALHRESGTLWAAIPAEDYPEFPYRLDETLGGADLFRAGSRTVHVVGDTLVAAETRRVLAAGDISGWQLLPVRPSVTPLHVLRPQLTTRYYGLLSRGGFSSVEEVEATPDSGLLALRGAGAKFLDAVRTAIADLGLGDLADLLVAAPATANQVAERRQLLGELLEPGPALRSRDFVELLARSSIPPTALQLIATALNAEPAPPADPAVVALLDTAGEHAILTHYTRTHAGAAVPRSRNQ